MSKSIDPHILPPQQVLITYSRGLPDFWADVESARTFFQGRISWPPYVYTPAACIAKLLERGGFDMEALPDTTISILAALAAWRLGQDIYRIDPDLYTDLFDSEIDCDIPHEVFLSSSLVVLLCGDAWVDSE